MFLIEIIFEIIKKYIMGVVTEDRFPHVEKLKSLGGVNTEEGDLYAKKYWEELENEYDAIMKLFQFRYKLGGNEKIHGINEK
jgi:hypothetical protein